MFGGQLGPSSAQVSVQKPDANLGHPALRSLEWNIAAQRESQSVATQ